MAGMTEDRLFEEALAWQSALERDDADWVGYVAWLEADPEHRRAADELALVDRALQQQAAALRTPPSIVVPPLPRRRLFVGVAAAAAVIAAVALPSLVVTSPDVTFAAGAGTARRVALGNGIAVELAAGSRLTALGGNTTRLRVDGGAMLFAVRHDPGRTLSIAVDDYVVRDIGTRFSVRLAGDALAVAVAEGEVSVTGSGGAAQPIRAGGQFVSAGGLRRATTINPDDVWSAPDGTLRYANVPLALVADDLARQTRRQVTVDPRIRHQPFSGILVPHGGKKVFDDLAALAGVASSEQGSTIILSPAPDR